LHGAIGKPFFYSKVIAILSKQKNYVFDQQTPWPTQAHDQIKPHLLAYGRRDFSNKRKALAQFLAIKGVRELCRAKSLEQPSAVTNDPINVHYDSLFQALDSYIRRNEHRLSVSPSLIIMDTTTWTQVASVVY